MASPAENPGGWLPISMPAIMYCNQKNYVEWDIKTEVTDSPQSYITDHKFVILDSLASYAKQTMDRICPVSEVVTEDKIKEIAKKVIEDITAMYEIIRDRDGNMTIVTLETGFSVSPDNKRQAAYSKLMGIINQRVANISTEVYLSASGIQFRIK